MLFKGLSAFPLTPTTSDGTVNIGALARLITRLVDAGVDSIGLLGSTGGYAYLTRDARRCATEIAVAVSAREVPVMVGVGALRTDEACQLARDAAEAGADALFMAPVSYTPLTDAEVFEHYSAVAAATNLQLCIYNNPGTTHFAFSAGLLDRLARVPRIVAVKMPLPTGGDVLAQLSLLRGGPAAALSIGYSGDWGIASALRAGADGFYSALAGVLPCEVLMLARAAQNADTAETQRIDDAFQPLWGLLKRFGGLRVSYSIARHLSIVDADPPRPILPLSGRDHEAVGNAVCAVAKGSR